LLGQLLNRTEYHPLRVLVSSDYLPISHWQYMIGDSGQVQCDLVDPVSLYLSVALALVRCGFVSYELALLGIPAVHIYTTAVQAEVAIGMESHGMGVAFHELHLPNSQLLDTALHKVSSMSPKPLNEQLKPGASLLADLLEKIHD
jgi:hypothetical protein